MMTRADRGPGTTPCVDCGSRYGAPPPHNKTSPIPSRTRGLCSVCYDWHNQRGTLHRFPFPTLRRTIPRATTVRLRHPGERRAERRALIAARVARHDSYGVGGQCVRVPEGDDFDHMQRRYNAEATSRAWLADHPDQHADWDHPEHDAFGASNATAEAA